LYNDLISSVGASPSTENKIIPGVKKLLKGDLFNIYKGIPINFPLGEIMKTFPPLIAPIPKNINKPIRIFREVLDFMILSSILKINESTAERKINT
jgi:hypothetical protein